MIQKKKKHKSFAVLYTRVMLVLFILYALSSAINARLQTTGFSVQTAAELGIQFEQISLQKISDTYKLYLVNSQHPNEQADKQLVIVPAYKRIPVSKKTVTLEQETLQQAERMVQAAGNEGIKAVITSGYRSREEQEKIYLSATDKDYVAKAGESEHELGLAIDINAINALHNINIYSWLEEHADEYGFILRYPQNKREITGVAYEPWHYRYVGVPHSNYICENKLSLEEYLDTLEPDSLYTVQVDHFSYLIYKTNAVNGKIRVPSQVEYEVSSDGTGAYIITAFLTN